MSAQRSPAANDSRFPESSGAGAPPRLAAALLNAILPVELRDDVIGDLQEGFFTRMAGGGAGAARRWYWRQALQSLRYAGNGDTPDPLRGRRPHRLQRAFMGFLRYDVAYALRQLRSNPGFTAVAVLSLALGIGVNATIFSVVNGFLLKPLPVADIDEVVEVFTSFPESGNPYNMSSYPDYLDYRADADAFSGLAASMMMPYSWNRETHSETLLGELVSDNYFDVLGLRPHLGRWFLPEENATLGTHPVAVLGYGFWERKFGADPSVVGSTIKLNGSLFTIVGVAPPQFGGMIPVLKFDLWTPLMTEPLINMFSAGDSFLQQRGSRSLRMFGRLAPGVTVPRARAQVETIAARLAQYPGGISKRSATLRPLSEIRLNPSADSQVVPVAGLLMGLVGLVLLVACANVANMLLARATSRGREIGVRLALGASRWRLVRQLLTESVVLSLLGGAVALLLTTWVAGLITRFQPPIAFNIALDVSPDGRVLLFTLGTALLTGVVFGLAPALRSSRPDVVGALKDDGLSARAGGLFSLRNALVVAQVAVSLVLLVAAGLLSRSLANAQSIDLGFDEQNLAYVSVSLSSADYGREESLIFLQQLAERYTALPGVLATSYATRMPLGLTNFSQGVVIEGYESDSDDGAVAVEFNNVGPGYFEALGVPLLAGRGISTGDDENAPLVAVVNNAFAQQYWPGQNPIGRRLRFDSDDDPWIEVVGVSGDYKMRTVGEDATPLLHMSILQQRAFFETLIVRTADNPAAVVARMSDTLAELDPDVAVFSSGTMADNLATVLFPVRMGAALLAVFGGLALALAGAGVYGVIAYAVSRRTREIGLRMALGASADGVLRLMVWQSMRVVLVGIALGALAAAGLSWTLAGFLYGVSAIDPIAFAATIAILLGVALLANYIPARRGARVDPMVALRSE